MAEQTHTPAPWQFDDDREGYSGKVSVFGANGSLIVTTGDMEDCSWRDILDARLISAAPDLLEALQRVADALWDTRDESYSYISSDTRSMIAAAIAKARNVEPSKLHKERSGFTCPGCGGHTEVVFNRANCPACLGED